MKLTDDQLGAIRALRQLWPVKRLVLIGASALGFHLEMRWRKTNDLDVAVAVEVDDIERAMTSLPGWRRYGGREHEWHSPQGVKVDVLPFSDALRKAGKVVWPRSGHEMNLVGMRLAFDKCREMDIGPNARIRVPEVASLVCLKMIAYLDRPNERERDLEDIAYVLVDYPEPDDERRFDDEVIAAGVEADLAGPFVLGKEVPRIVDATEIVLVQQFIAKVRDEDDPHGTQAKMSRNGPSRWKAEPKELLRYVEAFGRGMTG